MSLRNVLFSRYLTISSLLFRPIKRSQIRKGMVMVSPILNPQACWEFEGEILVLHHPTTISSRYQAMVHCGSIRQTASILTMSQDCLRTGDKAIVHFRFIKHPEYIVPGQRMVFREGRTKAVGNVLRLLTHAPVNIPNIKIKPIKQQRYSQALPSSLTNSPQRVLPDTSSPVEMGGVEKQENILQRSNVGKKGRGRRGGRGKSANTIAPNANKPLADVANITPIQHSNRTTTKVQ